MLLRDCILAFAIPKQKQNKTTIYKMPEKVKGIKQASNSVVISLAAYFVWKFPELNHPKFKAPKLSPSYKEVDKEFPAPHLSTHPLFEPWLDTFCNAVFERKAIREQNTLFVLCEVPQQYEKQLLLVSSEFHKLDLPLNSSLQEIFMVESVHNNCKVGYIHVGMSQLGSDYLKPKICVVGIILGTVFNNQKWKNFNILKGEIPNAYQLKQFNVLIIPGSTNSIMDSVEEVEKFTREMMIAYHQTKHLKILGLCYGHQLICREFKAILQKKPRFGGLQNVKFDNNVIEKYPFLSHLKMDRTCLVEHHEDFVESLPEEFQLLGVSNSCKIQAIVSKNSRILSFQFHPEYFLEYTFAFTARFRMHAGKEGLKKFTFKIPEEDISLHHDSSESVRQTIMNFISF